MASWNGTEVVGWKPEPIPEYPGWWRTDCGCCNGIQWSAGTEPIECHDCFATGVRCVHLATGTLAVYPGGALLGGRAEQSLIDEITALKEESDAPSL